MFGAIRPNMQQTTALPRPANSPSMRLPMPRFGFPNTLRLRTSAEFGRVYALRQRAGDNVLLVFAARNDLPHSRLGLSVSRKIGKAHDRVRWKRIIREAFRLSQEELPRGLDLVVIPRQGVEPSLPAVQQSLRYLARKLHRRLQREPT